MFAPELFGIDALIFLGGLYDWIMRRKLPISIFSVIAILFVAANAGYVALSCVNRECSPADCLVYVHNASVVSPSPLSVSVEGSTSTTTTRYFSRGDNRLCFSFSSRNVAKLCSKFDSPTLFARGFIYNVDGILSFRNGTLRLVPIVLYPVDVPYPMPRDCLNQCITQSKAIMQHLGHVHRKYLADLEV